MPSLKAGDRRKDSMTAGKWASSSYCIFVVFICLFCCGCSHQNRIKGTAYYRLSVDPTTLDPAFIVDVSGGSIAAKLFNGLVRLGDDLDVVPDIAGSWEIRDRGRVYIFYLRRDVKFSNSRAVTAYDFKYSFHRVLSREKRSPNTWVFERIAGAKEYMDGDTSEISGIVVVDRHTLRIRLAEPYSPFLKLLTMTPAYVVPKEEVERWGEDFSSHPVGTGPFLLKQWKHNIDLVLTRNDGYYANKAKVGGIIYRIIPEDLTAVLEFELGNLDALNVPPNELSRFRKSPRWSDLLSAVNGINTYYLGLNCLRPPFNNVKVRRAVSQAIDARLILDKFYEGRGRLAKGPVPDVLKSWNPFSPYPYDAEKAKGIIEEEGITGMTIDLYITTDQEVADMAEIIQSYLKKAGLNVRIKKLEWSAYKAAVNSGEPDVFWLSWWADYPDP
ncbi:MAG: ABC transporter substrate-binding protein, partial [Nitrospirae bacterium]|nr:ABC transporter substrate-binding protein [Nitrospirota bacterium]